jgi:2-polyprenyl-3-methyl-5-hydroxy-6-metoxy-1,4-benzoquinol methylase
MINRSDIIHTKNEQYCYLCGVEGHLLYNRLTDNLFHSPGEWNLRKCNDISCGLVWLDPMPREEDIWKAYTNYYTHTNLNSNRRNLSLGALIENILEVLLNITPIPRERDRVWSMGLKERIPGKLLEIGCGDGTRLDYFKQLGWIVEGQEIDSNTKSVTDRKHRVYVGDLCSLKLPPNSYDAIISNHVIEHLYNPIYFLDQCYNLLKSDGMLVAVTPNIDSLGSNYFKSNWRGLEPPRHIYLYSPNSLKKLAAKSLFTNISTSTTYANAVVNAASSLSCTYNCTNKFNRAVILFKAYLFQIIELLNYNFNKDIGEECFLTAYKNNDIIKTKQ